MHVTSLELTDFRNYKDTHSVEFSKEVNVLLGNNAQGKTNILESIYLIATARSTRTRTNSELVFFNSDKANIFLRSKSNSAENYFNLQIKQDNNKSIYVNGKQIKKATDLLGYLNVVMFSPEDIELITGSPALRRRFIDMFISQVKPLYAVNLSSYNKILKQRNKLLRDIKEKRSDIIMLDIWDEQLIETAIKIFELRIEALNLISEYADNFYYQISNKKENLFFEYITTVTKDNNKEVYLKKLKEKLIESRQKDIIYGSTSHGPHRDDIKLMINDNEAKLYGSQGQKRLVSLSLKYAEVEYIKNKVNEYPILLFDDVLLELDLDRKNNLLKELLNRSQVIITTTDLNRYDESIIKKATIFKIDNGSIYNSESKK